MSGHFRLLSIRMGLLPKAAGRSQGVDFVLLPPGNFISCLMELPVVAPAEWNRKFVAHLQPQGARLRKPQMVRIAGAPPADKTGL